MITYYLHTVFTSHESARYEALYNLLVERGHRALLVTSDDTVSVYYV